MRSPTIHPTSNRLRGFAAAAAVALLVVSCSNAETTSSPPKKTESPSVAASSAKDVRLALTPPGSYPVHIEPHVRYQRGADGDWHDMAVYSPAGEGPGRGPWPTVVMIHGAGNSGVDDWAYEVARRGAVVFVPYWRDDSHLFTTLQRTERIFDDVNRQLACAVKYARSNARLDKLTDSAYSGDPGYVSLFGFSAGANLAAQVAFNEPKTTPGCLASADSATPDNLVVMDGEWLMTGGDYWDPFIREDPGFMDLYLPWSHLATAPRMPVRILDTASEGFDTKAVGLGPIKKWLPMRDPTGELQRGLERRNALEDGTVTMTEAHQLLLDQLQGHGYRATLDILPDSGHGTSSGEGLITAANFKIGLEAIMGDWEPPDS